MVIEPQYREDLCDRRRDRDEAQISRSEPLGRGESPKRKRQAPFLSGSGDSRGRINRKIVARWFRMPFSAIGPMKVLNNISIRLPTTLLSASPSESVNTLGF